MIGMPIIRILYYKCVNQLQFHEFRSLVFDAEPYGQEGNEEVFFSLKIWTSRFVK